MQIRTAAPAPPEWLNNEQITRVLSIPDLEFRHFMLVALHTGCRRMEVLGLNLSNVDLPCRQIIVRGEIGKMGKHRTIPINNTLHEVFAKWSHERSGLLFPEYKSGSVSQKFRRWAPSLGFPIGISLHSLRATFACHLIEMGVDFYTISRRLGHSSVKVTDKHCLWRSINPMYKLLSHSWILEARKEHAGTYQEHRKSKALRITPKGLFFSGADGTRTRDLRRDRPAF